MGESVIPKIASEYINIDVYRKQLHCSLVRPLLDKPSLHARETTSERLLKDSMDFQKMDYFS